MKSKDVFYIKDVPEIKPPVSSREFTPKSKHEH